jgi:Domain of unknown function (DUF1992)
VPGIADAVKYESLADREIRLAREAGLFDGLEGYGKPLPNIDDRDEDWWINSSGPEQRRVAFFVGPLRVRARAVTTWLVKHEAGYGRRLQ